MQEKYNKMYMDTFPIFEEGIDVFPSAKIVVVKNEKPIKNEKLGFFLSKKSLKESFCFGLIFVFIIYKIRLDSYLIYLQIES